MYAVPRVPGCITMHTRYGCQWAASRYRPHTLHVSTWPLLGCGLLSPLMGLKKMKKKALIDIRLRPRFGAAPWWWEWWVSLSICRGVTLLPLLSHFEYRPTHFSRRSCFWPLCANMTLSIKPEIHNILQHQQIRTWPRPRATRTRLEV